MKAQAEDMTLTASAVSFASGVPQLTIRRWSREGLLTHRVDSAKRRFYGQQAIKEAQALRNRSTFLLRGE